ncbi:hypothetical protein BP6252_12022 [Coleophoma cylindrospora]|uniref:Rhodopsin domain-containing protein n=1 Tax=Coleophoma cylindrospora TaxID=1849047 RepID=A0A3D8QFR3_9HELO|nr:hypothetical protein BP6252_12022 [Coleophoma cylindrospora]
MTSLAMPAGTDMSENMQPTIIAINTIGLVLAVAAVGLRVAARKIASAPLWWDDWLVVFALVVGVVYYFMNVAWFVPHGLGKHIWAQADLAEAIWAFRLGLFIQELTYTTIIAIVKYSILAFYWRIFRVPSIRLPIQILAGIVTCWAIALWLVTIFQCTPVQGFWDLTIESNCTVNVTSFFFGNSIPNIFTDVALMILPTPYIWGLQLVRAQKIALISIFTLGTFIVVISATRLAYVLHLDLVSVDITWHFNNTEIWTTLEAYIAIICACLPSLKPIISLVFKSAFASRKATSNSNLNGSTQRSGTWANIKNSLNAEKKMPGDDENRLFKRLPGNEDGTVRVKVMASVSERSNAASDSDLELGDMNRVQIRRDFDVQWDKA